MHGPVIPRQKNPKQNTLVRLNHKPNLIVKLIYDVNEFESLTLGIWLGHGLLVLVTNRSNPKTSTTNKVNAIHLPVHKSLTAKGVGFVTILPKLIILLIVCRAA